MYCCEPGLRRGVVPMKLVQARLQLGVIPMEEAQLLLMESPGIR